MLHSDDRHERRAGQADVGHDLRFAFHYASEYRDRGYSVVPLQGKAPAIAWRELQRRRATLGEVASWFGHANSGAWNVGIVTGRISDLVVVDADDASAIAAVEEQCPPTPLVVETGRGGRHYYFRMPPDVDVRCRVRVGGKKIDIRAEGGLVVAPPSRHPDTGRPYFWLGDFHDYSLSDVPTYEPQWLEKRERPRHVHSPTTTDNPLAHHVLPHITDLRAYVRAIPSVSHQGGHNSCFRVACLFRDAGLSPEEALEELIAWNESGAAQPPWSEKELRHKIESAYRH
ncbi:MAG: bifunctional DNA primase/polymerase [Planctomycetales bacterium]|nr:bifunctional DNA primase/polymerase [Planctomycetales bacterium]